MTVDGHVCWSGKLRDHIFLHTQETETRTRLYTIKAVPQWCTSSDKSPLSKNSTSSLNTVTNWGPSVQICESMGDIFHSDKYKTQALFFLFLFSSCLEVRGLLSHMPSPWYSALPWAHALQLPELQAKRNLSPYWVDYLRYFWQNTD